MNFTLNWNLRFRFCIWMAVMLQVFVVQYCHGQINHAVEYSRLNNEAQKCTGEQRLTKLLLLEPHGAALHVDSALQVNSRALALLQEFPDTRKKAQVLHNLARCQLLLCNYSMSDSLLQQAFTLSDPNSGERAHIYRTMARLELRRPNIDLAKEHIANSIAIYTELNQPIEAWYTRIILVENLRGNKANEAYDEIIAGLEFADSVGEIHLKNLLLIELAYLHSYCSNKTEAIRISEQLIENCKNTEDRYMTAKLLSLRGDAFNYYDTTESRLWFEQAEREFIALDDHYNRALAYLRMSLSGAGYPYEDRPRMLDSADALAARHNMLIPALPLWRSWHVSLTDPVKAIELALITYNRTPLWGKKVITMEATKNLSDYYMLAGDSASAYKYLIEYEEVYQEIRGPEHVVLLGRIESKMAAEKDLEQQQLLALARETLKEGEIQRQKNARNLLIGAAALLIIILLLIYVSYKRERSSKAIISTQNANLARMDRLNKEVFSVIAHDFKSPLLSLSILTEQLDNIELSATEAKEYSTEIRNQVKQTSLMLENLLNWSRAELKLGIDEHVTCHPSLICDEIKNTLTPLSRTKAIDVVNHIPKHVEATIHPDVLRIVLRNLVSNAIKFSRHQQRVVIGFDEEEHSFYVKDDGVGVSPRTKTNLFKKAVLSEMGTNFETGFGLGLYITYELLRKSSWNLHYQSAEEQGTIFSFQPA